MVKIFIDPGHGGSDSGATGYGLKEKNLTLQIGLRIRDILLDEYTGVTVKMSRASDKTVSLVQRTSMANSWGADYFLSVHINAGGGTGFESYIYPNSGRPTSTYQGYIHNEIIKRIDLPNRGKRQADFHVLRETNMDAILTENGFIDSKNDSDQLKKSSFIEDLARGHVNGLAKAFSLKKKKVESTPKPKPNSNTEPKQDNTLYRVQIGAYKSRKSAEKLNKKAIAEGFDSFVREEDNLYKVQIGAFEKLDHAEELRNRARVAKFDAIVLS